MAKNVCNPCADNVFTRLSSNPDLSEIIAASVKEVIVVSGDEFIVVDNLETEDSITYTVTYNPYEPLVIQSFTDNLPLQIIGATVTDYILDWTYNIPVVEHSLTGVPAIGLTPPPPQVAQLTYQLIVSLQTTTVDTVITLEADDSTIDANDPKQATTSILFGNFLYTGYTTIVDTNLYDPLEADIKALTPTLAVNAKGANPITYTNSGVNVYQIFAAPTDSPFIVNNFQDSGNPLPGGFVEVKNDLVITNSEGHSADYTVWRTTYDNTAGLDGEGNPFNFSII